MRGIHRNSNKSHRIAAGSLAQKGTEVSNRRNCRTAVSLLRSFPPQRTGRVSRHGEGGGRSSVTRFEFSWEGGQRKRGVNGERWRWQERKFEDARQTRRAAVVIDSRQYGCAKSPFCSLSAALRKLLHPHLRIHAKSNRPSVHSRPSVRTSVRLSSPIIARQHCTAGPLHFFVRHRRPTPLAHPPHRIDSPATTSRFRGASALEMQPRSILDGRNVRFRSEEG